MGERLQAVGNVIRDNRRKVTAAAALFGVALTGCTEGKTKNSSWIVGVDCPADAKVDVTEVQDSIRVPANMGKITVNCKPENGPVSAPLSMELLAGSGTVVRNSDAESLERMTINTTYVDGGLNGQNSEINFKIDEEHNSAVINFEDIRSIKQVSVE